MKDFTLVQFRYGGTAPLSVPLLAHGLSKEGIDFGLKVFDTTEFHRRGGGRIEKLHAFIKESDDIIALGCFSDVLPYALAALKKLKRNAPEKTIILGGVGPSSAAEEIVETFDFVDFVIKGCGISPLPALIRESQSDHPVFDDIPDLVYARDGVVVRNDARDRFSSIPKLPRYDRLTRLDSYDRFLIQTSTGCPYRCTFCYALPAAGKKVKHRALNEVIEEIRLLVEINKGRRFLIRILDEAFVFRKERVVSFCELLKKNGLDIQWVCYGRIDRMDEDLLKSMAGAGCKEIFYGVESGSNRILTKIKKGFTIEDAFRIVELTQKFIPGVTASFIYRYPFETLADFKETFLAIRYLQFRNVTTQLHPLAPVVKSEIYRKYSEKLVFSQKEPSDYLCRRSVEFFPAECVELIKNNFRVFYEYGHYNPDDLNEINALIEKNRGALFSNIHRFWLF